MYLLIIFSPLYSFFTLIFFGKFLGKKGSIIISCLLLLISFFINLISFFEVVLSNTVVLCKLEIIWMSINNLNLNWSFLFDSLTICIMFIIIFISLLVHIYSVSYMNEDPYIIAFLSYLSLFTFFMLLLVTSDNLLQMFIGWEGVGYVSFLLISFWHTRVQAVKSAIKAVLVNRVGDLFLLLSFLIIYKTLGVFDYFNFFLLLDLIKSDTISFCWLELRLIEVIIFLITLGCMAKSAQIFLHTWLPDAMEGPTPVSALLHAATMVTAGIYLTIRCSALLVEANNVCCFIVLIGALTAVMSASIALMQDDIKKIIAYSTCSQLGYMYFSAGLLNFEVSFYHLINHAFFKALLFLSAGAIIHSLNDEQDLKKMGGLVNLLPFTYSVLIIASLAIMGFPYLTGFYSKDLLLELNFINNNTIVSGFSLFIALFTALLTNLYSLRLLYLVFFSRCNSKRILIKYVHDSPLFMMIPQFILAVFTIFVGFLLSDSFVGMGTDMWNGSILLTINKSFLVDAEFMGLIFKHVPFILFVLSFCSLFFSFYFYKDFLFNSVRKNYYIVKQVVFIKYHNYYYLYKFLCKRWLVDLFYNKIILNVLRFSYLSLFRVFERGVLEYLGPLGFLAYTQHIYSNYIIIFNKGIIYHYSYIAFLSGIFIIFFSIQIIV